MNENEDQKQPGINEPPEAKFLIASILYLMTCYVRLPDKKVSAAIIEHLEMLAEHPDCESEVLKKAGTRLALQWGDLIEQEQNLILSRSSNNNCGTKDTIH